MGTTQSRLGRDELVSGVVGRSGRTGGVDGALGLVEFAGRGLDAARRQEHGEEQKHSATDRKSHCREYTQTLRHLAPHDRPREKLARLGTSALGDNELLAVVLGYGSPGRSALDLANAILARAGGLVGLTRAYEDQLRELPGVGPARVAQVCAAIELGRRTLRPRDEGLRFATSREMAAYLLPQFGARRVEQCGTLLLDRRGALIKASLLTVGTADASLVPPSEILREALVAAAAGFVLFHNHPSGDPSPSPDDKRLTTRMAAGAELIGVQFVDHLILADACYYSFREVGYLPGWGPLRPER